LYKKQEVQNSDISKFAIVASVKSYPDPACW